MQAPGGGGGVYISTVCLRSIVRIRRTLSDSSSGTPGLVLLLNFKIWLTRAADYFCSLSATYITNCSLSTSALL